MVQSSGFWVPGSINLLQIPPRTFGAKFHQPAFASLRQGRQIKASTNQRINELIITSLLKRRLHWPLLPGPDQMSFRSLRMVIRCTVVLALNSSFSSFRRFSIELLLLGEIPSFLNCCSISSWVKPPAKRLSNCTS